jgi:hypothetical protein
VDERTYVPGSAAEGIDQLLLFCAPASAPAFLRQALRLCIKRVPGCSMRAKRCNIFVWENVQRLKVVANHDLLLDHFVRRGSIGDNPGREPRKCRINYERTTMMASGRNILAVNRKNV